MTPFERLITETEPARARFASLPMLQQALHEGVDRDLYGAYLGEAYHHVRHTCPLLAAAASRCGPDERYLREALFRYIDEEKGHEEWILDDIRAIAGQAEAARVVAAGGGPAVRAMVGYMYFAVERIGPHAVLGMVHVLEGTSIEIAGRAAAAIANRLGTGQERGFSYLRSHGEIDRAHVAFLRDLVDGIDDPALQNIVIDAANMVYRLWGAMFADLVAEWQERRNAA